MIQILVGVQVQDKEGYAEYRRQMTPLLEEHGGRFVVDVEVHNVLKSPGDAAFNRLFSIEFPSDERRRAFFENPLYLRIRGRYFDASVAAVSQLGRFEVLI